MKPRTGGARRTDLLPVLLPVVVMTVVVCADVLAGPSLGFLPLLSLGPALAAVALSPARTAIVGGVALAACLPLADYDGLLGSRRAAVALATVAGVTIAGMIASADRRRRQRELADISAVAEAAQVVVLRPLPKDIGDIHLAVRYISASASAQIGGDLYEVVVTDNAIRLIVGDVQGHGLAAVQTAAVVLGAFREIAYDALGLTEIAGRVEASLRRHLTDEEFVTAVLAEVPLDGRAVEILNCGHPPPLLVSPGAERFIEPAAAALPLGLSQLLPSTPQTCDVPLGEGDCLLFYTDGITEARSRAGNFYPLRNCGALFTGQDADAWLDRLRDDVVRHVGHQLRDDAAMLLISRRRDEDFAAGSVG